MSETARNPKNPKGISWNARLGLKALLGILAVGIFAWFLGGSFGVGLRTWQEGRVAPYTVYAPMDFFCQDQGRPVEVQRGELLVSKGERLTAVHVARLQAMEKAQSGGKTGPHWFGAFLLAALFTAVIAIYLRRYELKIWRAPRQQALIVTVVATVLVLARLILESPLDSGWIPVAAVPMLVGMLLEQRLGIVVGLLVTGLVALRIHAELPLIVGLSVGSFVGGYLVRGIRRRIDFFWVALIIGAAQAVTIFCGYLIMEWPFPSALERSAAALVSGVLASLLTYCLLPICETVFQRVTEVTLLEISDLNHPLLRELSVKAPGTYHHSLIVARLAEAACEAIGANTLLARVGCYFHDIGKMLHPEYFVENQPPAASRHDRLAPSMSSLVILNHVKEGIKLAQRYHLNQAIIDFIPGHHGTGLIYYFYRRALEEVEDETQLKEERFRYPGPKPQTRETAVALLADSSEAASRALPEKNPAKIQEVVRRIVNNKFIDGQLDECDLTLKDLHRISEAFIRVLAGIYHTRIEYPKLPGEESDAVVA